MKRKEDLKKLCREEKNVLPADRLFYYSIFISLLFFSGLSAQIPVNGFCRYREFSAKPNFKNIFSADYNSDGYRDLLISSSDNNKYLTLFSDSKSNYGKPSEKYLSFSVSDIHAFGNEITGKRYLIESRRTRDVILGSFSRSGVISQSGRIRFDGFPSSIDVRDINGDGRPEGLVSGNSLDGLYILRENKRSLIQTKIDSGKVFSWSGFIDLDYDSFPDIAAVDPVSGSLVLYSNDRLGNFTESRSIPLYGDVSECKSVDMNSNGFIDIVYIKNNRFEILLGDSVSSFRKKILINTPASPDKFAVLDFNGDGFNDLAFLDVEEGELYISFGKGMDTFHPSILYLKKKGIINLSAFIDRSGKKLAILNSSGEIYLINSLELNDTSFMAAFGSSPASIQTFDFMNDKYRDICFVDEGSHSLNILLSERRRLFRTYYSIPLNMAYTKIFVDDNNPKEKTFFCYSKGERSIEIIRMNFDSGSYSRYNLYTEIPISDIEFSIDRLRDWQNLYVLCQKGKDFFLQNFEIRNFVKTSSSIYPVATNAENAWISSDVYRVIYTLSRSGNKFQLIKSFFNKKITESKIQFSFEANPTDRVSFDLVCLDETISHARPAAALVSVNNKSYIYYIRNNNAVKYSLKNAASINSMFGYFIEAGGEEPTFYYNLNRKTKLQSAKFMDRKNPVVEQDLIESKDINNYLIAELNKGRTFLISSNTLHKTISVEKL
ncbi:MAG: hypothetical protein CVV24_05345 [Ignavibacteriae bacterium HGW-Ignavibacteriae-3]|nr:MAG: hypothetical protein CVV24_05345 [Ignavibacteriae bacterium HGW-Ignavibacteriae-3]